MTSHQYSQGLAWRKSSHSNGQANCVEIAAASSGIAIRDSKDPHGPVLLVSRDGMAAFLAGIRNGEFGDIG
jgi:hypothetical protein